MATQLPSLTVSGQPLYDPARTVPLSFSYYKTWLVTFLESENHKGNSHNPKIGIALSIYNVMQNYKNTLAYDEKTKVSDLTTPQSTKVFSISEMIRTLNDATEYGLEQLTVRLFHAILSISAGEPKPSLYQTSNIVLTQQFELIFECFGRFPEKKSILSYRGVNFSPESDSTENKLRFNVSQVYNKTALSKDKFTLHDAKLSVPFSIGSALLPKRTSTIEFDLLFRAFPTTPGTFTFHLEKEVFKESKEIPYASGKIAYDGRKGDPTQIMKEERLTIQAEEGCTITADHVTFDILSKTGTAELKVEKVEEKSVHILVRLNTKQTDPTTDDRGVVEFKVNFTQNKPLYGPGTVPHHCEIGWNTQRTVTPESKVARLVYKSIFNGKEHTFDPNDPTTFLDQPPYLYVRQGVQNWHLTVGHPAPPIDEI